MSDQTPINPQHNQTRDTLRAAGVGLAAIGGLMLAIGILDFLSSFGSMRMPTLFIWCSFPGMILLGIGMNMAHAGYAGKIARYYSQEIAPPAVDTFKYVANEAKDSVREIAGAIGEGLRGTATQASEPVIHIRCHKCNHDNEANAKFCCQCGAALAKSMPCPNCSELNDPDAKFCDNCGRALAT